MIRAPLRIAISCFYVLTLACGPSADAQARELFVAKDGDDQGAGTSAAPFLTINRAAQVAQPGDTVTVRAGVYREWVNPARGGSSEDARIVYQSAPGERVRLLGSEVVTGWQKEGNLHRATVPNSTFGDFNPFATLTRHPQDIIEDQTEGAKGWGWLNYGKWDASRRGLLRRTSAPRASDQGRAVRGVDLACRGKR